MKTSPFLTLLFGLIVLLSGFMEFQEKFSAFHYILEFVFGSSLMASAIFMVFKPSSSTYWWAVTLSFGTLLIYGVFFAQNPDFFHGILTGISGYIFVMQLIELWKFYGKSE